MIEVLPPDHPSPGRIEQAAWKVAHWFSRRRDLKWLRMHDADLRAWNRTALDPSAHKIMRCPNCGSRGSMGETCIACGESQI